MGYTIIFVGRVIRKDLPDLPKTIRLRIVNAINERLIVDPVTSVNYCIIVSKGVEG
ncbi:MAG: hypothetical protein ACR5KV_08370 [Wolbachia sp.]